MAQTPETDVAIVGGGPVGLGLAMELARRGVRTQVLERSTELHAIPKGQNLTQRTGEHFRAWGIGDAVRTASPIPPDFGNSGLVAYRQLLSPYSYDWFQRSTVRPYYFADNERLPQYALERVMRARVARIGEIGFQTGAQVTQVQQDDDGVCVTYQTADGPRSLRARYGVGCDGARSLVREAAGIEQATDHQGPRMVLLVFRSTELHDLLERYPGKSVFNALNPDMDGYWQFLGRVDLDGGWFYHAPVPEGTTADNYDFRAHLHQAVGAEFALDFDHIGFWDLRISLADTYRSGRVFIAGDAAHSHPPYGGYGVNTGLEDARNLGWKLAAVLAGWGGADLLDSYSAERHPVFASTSRDFIQRMIISGRDFTQKFDPDRDRAAFEAEWTRRAEGGNAEVTEFLPNYAGSPLVFGPGGAVSGAVGQHSFAAAPGYHLAPQSLGAGRDLWDELGTGFALIALGAEVETAGFQDAAAGQGLPLQVIRADAALRDAYGAALILVRPDQFVAWTGDTAPSDAGAVLARARGA